ncbi:MAG: AMIN domain-containing protein [Micavibrio aeruginosavorus]|uniref:AMIN domain-containing protein n=1 Tax=Micavibrio aeruginosavorus TaxID=349221 RepID=A0A7T5UHZ4_9BACT|nr:MAG: AMIN domain-containing protein [Micavibrio aeruginosavorus]
MAGRNFKAIGLTSLMALSLSACGWVQEDPYQQSYRGGYADMQQASAPPQTRVMQTADATWLMPDQTPKPVPTATELAELKQANTRIAELEDEIAALRNDMSMMMPALTKLAGGEAVGPVDAEPVMASGVAGNLNQIQTAAGGSLAAGEIGRVHQDYTPESAYDEEPEAGADSDAALTGAAKAAPPAPVRPLVPPAEAPAYHRPPSTTAPAVATAAPAPTNAAYTPPVLDVTSIQAVRFGQHDNGKSRLVIDTSAARDFHYDIDNAERILVLEIPGTVWNAGPVTKNILDHPLVQSMTAAPDGQGGTRVVFQLLKPVQVLWSQAIPPSGSQGHRIVVDIASN